MQVNCITADCVKLGDVGSPAGSRLKFAVFYQANTAHAQLVTTVSTVQTRIQLSGLDVSRPIIYL